MEWWNDETKTSTSCTVGEPFLNHLHMNQLAEYVELNKTKDIRLYKHFLSERNRLRNRLASHKNVKLKAKACVETTSEEL